MPNHTLNGIALVAIIALTACGGGGEQDERAEHQVPANDDEFDTEDVGPGGATQVQGGSGEGLDHPPVDGGGDAAETMFPSLSIEEIGSSIGSSEYKRWDAWGLAVGDVATVQFVDGSLVPITEAPISVIDMVDIDVEITGAPQPPPDGIGVARYNGDVIAITTGGDPYAGITDEFVAMFDEGSDAWHRAIGLHRIALYENNPLIRVTGDFSLVYDFSQYDGDDLGFRAEITNLDHGYRDIVVDFDDASFDHEYTGFGEDETSVWSMEGGFRGSGSEAFVGTFGVDYSRGLVQPADPDFPGHVLKGAFAASRTE